jgi:hypothetical protein
LTRVAAGAAVLGATVLLAPPLHAQAATGALAVTIVDAAGAPVSGASILVDGPDGARLATTDGGGEATLLHLRPGHHRVRVPPEAAEGDVLVGAGGTTRATLRLSATTREVFTAATTLGPGGRATIVDDAGLRALPRPADPWSVLRDVPGVVLDRVDVGGSETAQQSLVISRGDAGAGAA